AGGAGGVAGPVGPDADARGGVVLDAVVPDRVRRPARVHRPRAAVAGLLAGAGVVLDDVAAGTLFDVDALGAAGVDGVAAHLVGVARVRFRGGVAVELLGRRADVDALTVLALAGVRDREVVDTARAALVVRDEVAGGEVLQPDALAAEVRHSHPEDPRPGHPVVRDGALHVDPLVAEAVLHELGADGAVDREPAQRRVVVADLEHPTRGGCAAQHGVARAGDRDAG